MLRGWSCRGEGTRELPVVLESDCRGDWLSLEVGGFVKQLTDWVGGRLARAGAFPCT